MTAYQAQKISGTKAEIYCELAAQLRGLLDGERDPVANAANASALIFCGLEDLNWAGFYFLKGDTLVLGPFQGQPACVRIPLGKGVCGAAAAKRETLLVADVHEFPGHIACDAASVSEMVIPLLHKDRLLGVLDLDSPQKARFDAEDQHGCEALARIWVEMSAHA
jgi:GAF domain-containing protein